MARVISPSQTMLHSTVCHPTVSLTLFTAPVWWYGARGRGWGTPLHAVRAGIHLRLCIARVELGVEVGVRVQGSVAVGSGVVGLEVSSQSAQLIHIHGGGRGGRVGVPCLCCQLMVDLILQHLGVAQIRPTCAFACRPGYI